jgi:hypothetical protein
MTKRYRPVPYEKKDFVEYTYIRENTEECTLEELLPEAEDGPVVGQIKDEAEMHVLVATLEVPILLTLGVWRCAKNNSSSST